MDIKSKEARSYNMSRIRNKDTKPEELVRKYLFSCGFRYRKNDTRLPGKPDIVLPKYKTVICKYFVWPKSNVEFWENKISKNISRDQINYKLLKEQGWKVLVVWECELKKQLREETLRNLSEKIRSINA